MAKITREPQKIFGGSLTAADNIATFGSTKAGTPTYSLDPSTLQSTAFLSGWAAALVNNNAPTVQELNGVFYVATYQLAYLLQTGVPEFSADTVYYTGSIVNNGTGALYAATADPTQGTLVTDQTKWECIVPRGVTAATGPTPTIYYRDGAATFDIAAGAGGNKTIAFEGLPNGAVVNILVNGVATNTVTFGVTKEDGSSLTLAYPTTYSNTMSGTKSLFTLIRVGNICIINSQHGIA